MSDFALDKNALIQALDDLGAKDTGLANAVKQVGYPDERRRPAGFQTLMHIIAGQQISTRAAATIVGRLHDATAPVLTPESFLKLSAEQFRTIGFSRQKILYGTGLSEAILDGRFYPDSLAEMTDEEVLAAIMALKGFGRWSAEMYLLFSLGRPDVWPADDLAIRVAVQNLKHLPERPGTKEMDTIAEPWRPWRGAVAIFLWHYYKKFPEL